MSGFFLGAGVALVAFGLDLKSWRWWLFVVGVDVAVTAVLFR